MPERSSLERAGLMFQHYECFAAAAGAFSRLIEAQPGNPAAWCGLANTLVSLAGQKQDPALFRDAMACIKSALRADPDHEPAQDLFVGFPSKTGLSQGWADNVEAFTVVPPDLAQRAGLTDTSFAEAMLEIPFHGRRMQVVMWLGGLDEPCAREILLVALDDSNVDVQMAALKRLPASNDSRVVAKLRQLAESDVGRNTEPYLSVALKRYVPDAADSDHWAVRLLASLEQNERLPGGLDPRVLSDLFQAN